MSPNETLRSAIGKVPAGLLFGLSLLGFWVLSRGMTVGPASMTGYAEALVHSVGPLQAGRVQAIPVQLGQRVRAGDVIALLDPHVLALQRDRIQAELRKAEAALLAEQETQGAQLQRGQIQAVRAHAAEERARAELRELDQQVRRLEKLDAEHLIHAAQIEEARRRQRTVAADLQARPGGSARELELMGLRPRPQEDQAARLEERLAPFRAALHVQQAALRQAEYALAELTLRAPVDGSIGALLQRPGDVVGAGTPIVQIVTARPGHVVAFVPERQVRSVAPGAGVVLRRVGAVFGALHGHVVELAPLVEEVPPRLRPSPQVPLWARRVVIELDEPAPLLPGEAFRVGAR